MSLRVGVGQLCSSSNVAANARVISKLIGKAVAEKVQVLFLPEASDYISRDAKHSVELARKTSSEFVQVIRQEIKKSGQLYVGIGVHEPAEDNGKRVRNNQLWIDPQGNIVETYQKVHLFDVEVKDGPILKESNSVEPGNKIVKPVGVGNTDFKVGLAICYDIRFPELALRLRKLGADIITFPSAFTTKTGEAHWELLARARAVDTQSFVVMAAQCGPHDIYADVDNEKKEELAAKATRRESYGESIIVSPWGKVLVRLTKYSNRGPVDEDGDYYELGVADLSKDEMETIRRNMPLLAHRRPDVFGYEI